VLDAGNEIRYSERTFAPDGSDGETVHFQLNVAK
jgi:hypothetical protein